jgi:hypothetical protein
MIKLRKKLYYLLFSVKNFGLLDGFILWLNLEVFETSTISVPGIKYEIILRKNTSDKNAFKQIFLLNEYDLFDFKSPKTVIDAGGNIGLFSILVKKKYPDSKIICIEPDEENYSILSKNLSFYSNIFNGCDIVLCGDIHKRQTIYLDNVIEVDDNDIDFYLKNGWDLVK